MVMARAAAQDQAITSTEELLQGQLELWHHALGFIKSMAFKCAMDLRIPDAILRCGGTATLPELLAATELPPCNLPYLHRLMRVLTLSRIFAQLAPKQPDAASGGEGVEEAVYALTAASRLLVNGSGGGDGALFSQFCLIHPFVDRTCVSPFFGMHSWIEDERAATTSLFEREHGEDVWQMARANAEGFNQGMAADTGLVMHAVLRESPAVFDGVTSLVDVGGGYGAAAAAVARVFPHIECTVLDLPHVVALAADGAGARGSNVLRFVAGDMFKHIPPADAVLLKWILHDWNDDDCIKILQECKKAIPPRDAGGKVIIIEVVVSSRPCDAICNETQALFDLYMMVMNGAEREEHQWRRIFLEAGFRDYKITPILGFRSIIEVYP